jgi:uncharacterized phage infection (PIP) family protein YhgE
MLDPHTKAYFDGHFAALDRKFITLHTTFHTRLDLLMATAQNILDATQNLSQATVNLTTAVHDLSERILARPEGVLTSDQADSVVQVLATAATGLSDAVSQLNELFPAA